ncbi:hypothetical protein KAJ83_03550 [Marivibrio halodurans]|uniref:Histidine phosphotransferase ChpT C-terminal domain-containing protein n=1 Tax=Marivibrio halodurans TaxID=2039722 RepID=A0A8J7V2S4_9PROT|nr:histidine phosphotransferase family protein [Marivibrio halodurans]MBP5856069.1 hypothetical protein [Marivibrio halodurans]
MSQSFDQALRLSELVTARFAHELVGASGAISNGLELIEEMGGEAGQDVTNLVSESAANLKARLQFYRMAYGRAGREAAGLPELRALTVGFLEHVDGVTLDWPMAPVVPVLMGGEGKLILNLIALAAETLPRGGVVTVSLDDACFLVTAEGTDMALRQEVAAAMTVEMDVEALTPRTVHAYLTAVLCAESGRSAVLQRQSADRLALMAVAAEREASGGRLR